MQTPTNEQRLISLKVHFADVVMANMALQKNTTALEAEVARISAELEEANGRIDGMLADPKPK